MVRMLGIILGTLVAGLLSLLLFWVALFGPQHRPDTPNEVKARAKAERERDEAVMEWIAGIQWAFWSPTSEDVVEAFREEGLEVGATYPLEESPPPFLGPGPIPKTYTEATRFEIPSLGRGEWGGGKGGRIFVFNSEKDLEVVSDYYGAFSRFGWSHLYRNGLVLVQINGELPKEKAKRYGEALKSA
jgi:hypothetical protein